MRKRNPNQLTQNDVTPEHIYNARREWIQKGLVLGSLALLPKRLFGAPNPKFNGAGLEQTPEDIATSYNNFYEFSLDKNEVKDKVGAWALNPATWKLQITGLEGPDKSLSLKELETLAGPSEERIYRFRCVEAWSMVVPWSGVSIAKLIEKLKPKKTAKYLKFQSYGDKNVWKEMNNQPGYPWPYTEGLTLAEAMNPLAMLVTGAYGKPLAKQNGAPVRLIVPWKYGFKSAKSLVKIEFTDKQPETLWSTLAPSEYGFYANVNPNVDHPRWSQASERVLSKSFLPKRQPTLMFNGYEKEVASLYKSLDLKKNY